MAEHLLGAPATAKLTEELKGRSEALRARGIIPTICVFRVGERPDDLAYEKGILKRCEACEIAVNHIILDENTTQAAFEEAFSSVNEDPKIHGILLFRPLPKTLDEEKIRQLLRPEKDMDGWTDASLAGVFANTKQGYPPCTAEAVMALLEHYDIDPKGKRAVVLGRSLVIGRPVSMLLMHKNATVTTCHTGTKDTAKLAAEAELLVSAVGHLRAVGPEYTNPGQIVIDVGINWDAEAERIKGDVDFEAVEPLVSAITPVPGGIGSLTTAVLCRHVIEAAEK